jgi:hypothetical protein
MRKENLRTPITHPSRTWNNLSMWWLWKMKKHGNYLFHSFLAFSQRHRETTELDSFSSTRIPTVSKIQVTDITVLPLCSFYLC